MSRLWSGGSAGWGRSRPAETLSDLPPVAQLNDVNKRWKRLLKPAKCFRMCAKPACSASVAWSCAMLDWFCCSLWEVWDGLSRGKPSYYPVTDYRHGETCFSIIKCAQTLFKWTRTENCCFLSKNRILESKKKDIIVLVMPWHVMSTIAHLTFYLFSCISEWKSASEQRVTASRQQVEEGACFTATVASTFQRSWV